MYNRYFERLDFFFGLHLLYSYLQPDMLLFSGQELDFGSFLVFLGRVGMEGLYGELALA
jgi:hypothetical protein